MAERLKGKVAIITGGSGGIGAETAKLFWQHGAAVTIVDLDQDALDKTANSISPGGERMLAVSGDLTKESEVESVVKSTVDKFGKVDVLANIAAVRVHGPITEATAESWDFVIGVNLLAVSHCCKYAIPEMVKAGGGSIINVSSANATVGRKGMAQYDATKNAVLALTRSMACDHAEQGVRVNAISPGPTLTSFHIRNRVKRTGETPEEAEAAMRAAGAPHTLLNRQAEPIEMAYPLLFLASDESSYVTGANFAIDGGISGLRD